MKHLLVMLAAVTLVLGCNSEDEDTFTPDPVTPRTPHTVMVYMTAENNLSCNANSDIK